MALDSLDTFAWELSQILSCSLESLISCSPGLQRWEMGLLVPKPATQEATEESRDENQGQVCVPP